jgi:hypothetical protein
MASRASKLSDLDVANTVANSDLLYLVSNNQSFAVSAQTLFEAFKTWLAQQDT